MGKRKMIEALEKEVTSLQRRVKALEQRTEELTQDQTDLILRTLDMNLVERLKEMEVDWQVFKTNLDKAGETLKYDANHTAGGNLGVPAPGVWRIRSSPDLSKHNHKGKKKVPYCWWANDEEEEEDYWASDIEYAKEYHSLIEAARGFEEAKVAFLPKGYLPPVIIEPSGGVYNEKDGRDPDAVPLEPKLEKQEAK